MAGGASGINRKLLHRYIQATVRESRIPRRPMGALAPLSFAQEELWLRQHCNPDIAPLYNECIRIELRGELKPNLLADSLNAIVGRHEIWRTTFHDSPSGVIQKVQSGVRIDLPVADLSPLQPADRSTAALRLIEAETRRRFDLDSQPPIRVKLIRLDETFHLLFVIAHLLVLDGVSAYQVFPSELAAIYKALLNGTPPALPELKVQYGDFSYWQRNSLSKNDLSLQLEYWRKRLLNSNQPSPPEPAASQPPRFRGAIRSFRLSDTATESARLISRTHGTTLFVALLATWVSLLARQNGETDILVGTLSPSGRKRSEVLDLIGHFLNPVALRFTLSERNTFADLIQQARTLMLEAMSNDDVPMMHVARDIRPQTDPISRPLARYAISLQPRVPDFGLPWSVSSMDVDSGGSPWDLYLAFIERPNRILGRVQFNPEAFSEEEVTELVEHFQFLLTELATNPSAVVFPAGIHEHAASNRT